MNEATTADPNSVRKLMKVQAPPAVAWRVAVVEPRVGGRGIEVRFIAEGDWGKLLAAFARAVEA
ncbi:MAG TPA: hypothetical protein VN947_11265 [Polyangia bacterium]|nr:hypothetical protein [Polyangia bacterium]